MGVLSIVPVYLLWHYTRAYSDYMRIWTNYLWFIGHFFSIGFMARTLFIPLFQVTEEYPGPARLGETMGAFLVNVVVRGVSAGIRIFVMGAGVLTLFFGVMVGILGMAIWTLLPMLVVLGIITGIGLMV